MATKTYKGTKTKTKTKTTTTKKSGGGLMRPKKKTKK